MIIKNNISLKNYNTFKIDVKAKEFVEINSENEIHALISGAYLKNKNYFILGGGSNVLFSKDFDGIVVKINTKGKRIIEENSENIYIKVSAGEEWHNFVEYTLEKNYGGIENLSLIPGTVGASPVQNIGAYGVELKDVFYELQAIEIESGNKVIFKNKDCEFSYRNSIFKGKLKNKHIITSVVFRLQKHPVLKTEYGNIKHELKKSGIKNPDIKEISKIVCNIRNNKLPDVNKIGNAGSFFKNPLITKKDFLKLKNNYPDIVAYKLPDSSYKLAAGWLIDKSGLKGKTFGNAGIHKEQALVIINKGNSTAGDILNTMKNVQSVVFNKFKIRLLPEVNII